MFYRVRQLFYLGCEALSGLESRNVVLGDRDGRVLRDVTSHLRCALLDDEATKTTEVYVLAVLQRALHAIHESLYDGHNLHLLNAGAFCDFAYDICLSHILWYIKLSI